ncbi:MAG: FprA family A-type flavoprotein [Elusimicrobiales bacterium]
MGEFKAVKIAEKVWWVGAIDWGLRDFHGYSTRGGSTYNAYLVMGEEPVLIDTVKAPFYGEMLSRIASVTDPGGIKTVISNHSEMDHSGSLPRLLAELKPQRVLCSAAGKSALEAHFHADLKLQTVADGQETEIGGLKFTFMESKMLHWPDSMVSFLHDGGVLFSNDIFGMHLAHSKRFDDETPDWRREAAAYYANIVLPYSPLVLAFLARFKAKNFPVKLIAPDHGPVWRKDIAAIISLYEKWARQEPSDLAVIAYDTMWQSTALLANALADGLIEGGARVQVMPLKADGRSDIATELLEAGALFLGAPTLNRQVFPSMADLTVYLKGLNRRNLTGAAFGSYGWSGEGPDWLAAQLKEMGVAPAGETLKCRYVPDAAALDAARRLGLSAAGRLLRKE